MRIKFEVEVDISDMKDDAVKELYRGIGEGIYICKNILENQLIPTSKIKFKVRNVQ